MTARITRGSGALAFALTIAGTAVGAPIAHANEEAGCSYRLTGPQLTPSADHVEAGLEPESCPDDAMPVKTTICLRSVADAGTCVIDYGWNRATAMWDPPESHTTYTVTGTGCSSDHEYKQTCKPLGPFTAAVSRS